MALDAEHRPDHFEDLPPDFRAGDDTLAHQTTSLDPAIAQAKDQTFRRTHKAISLDGPDDTDSEAMAEAAPDVVADYVEADVPPVPPTSTVTARSALAAAIQEADAPDLTEHIDIPLVPIAANDAPLTELTIDHHDEQADISEAVREGRESEQLGSDNVEQVTGITLRGTITSGEGAPLGMQAQHAVELDRLGSTERPADKVPSTIARLRPPNFQQFARDCSDSGIEINPELLANPRYSGDGHCCQPNKWLGAVAAAGNMLRKDPSVELVSAPIPRELLGTERRHLVARTALFAILNASRNRVEGNTPGATFYCESAKRLDTCAEAEEHFVETFLDMKLAAKAPLYSGWGWSVLFDGDRAIGVTKPNGVESTLSLDTFTVNGIPYPPGSLFRVDTRQEVHSNDDGRLFISSEAVDKIAFLRLSAFALPAISRATFGGMLTGDYTKDWMMHTWGPQRIQELAQRVMTSNESVSAGA